MFDLITGKTKHMPGGGGGPVVVSTAIHITLLAAVIVVPLLFMTNVLPEAPAMMAFVGAPSSPPPPPPPPPPPAPARAKEPVPTAPSSASPDAAPINVPSRIEPESTTASAGDQGGVEGGVVGGVPGGVVGGIVGGIPTEVPPPPPPPPAPAPSREPIRIGGAVQQPALVRRVEPIYPELAVRAHMEGVVILEAVVDEQGVVQNVRVLRSIPLLDKAAITAVEQWHYSPVTLNGRPVPFVLTVVVSFSIPVNRTTKY